MDAIISGNDVESGTSLHLRSIDQSVVCARSLPRLAMGRRDLLTAMGLFAGASAGLGAGLIPTDAAAQDAMRLPAAATLPMPSSGIEPFTLAIPQQEIDDLRRRLERTRWPDPETVQDRSQGARLADVQALCEYWRTEYDWRRCETMLNGFGQFRTAIDGLGIYFLHVRSPHAGAMPMIMTHGWPGSIIEFHEVIGPLTDPTAHGGDADDAFHLIIPSLPGYGFSDKPRETGWGVERTAQAWATLMERLGYDRWVAQGGDWGAAVTNNVGALAPAGCQAIHVNTLFNAPQPGDEVDPSTLGRLALEKAAAFGATGFGYAVEQGTRPQTLGYGLADSQAGQAAWIYEKFQAWTDNPGEVEAVLTRDEMLDDIMLYWLTNAGASSARLYWESLDNLGVAVDLPVAVSVYLNDVNVAPREWAERSYSNIVSFSEVDRGGHFAAFEQPDLFVNEVRAAFRPFR